MTDKQLDKANEIKRKIQQLKDGIDGIKKQQSRGVNLDTICLEYEHDTYGVFEPTNVIVDGLIDGMSKQIQLLELDFKNI